MATPWVKSEEPAASFSKDPKACTPFTHVLVNYCHYRRNNRAPPGTGPWLRVVKFGSKDELREDTKDLVAYDDQELMTLPIAFPFPIGVTTARTTDEILSQQSKGERLMDLHFKKCEESREEVAENIKYRRMGRNELSVEQMINTDVDEIAERKAAEDKRRRDDEADLVREFQQSDMSAAVAATVSPVPADRAAPGLKPLKTSHMTPFQNFAIITVLEDHEAIDENKVTVRAWFEAREKYLEDKYTELLWASRRDLGFRVPESATYERYVIEVAKATDLTPETLRAVFKKYTPERHSEFEAQFWTLPGAFDYARNVVLASWIAAHPKPEVSDAELSRYISIVDFKGTRDQALKALFEDDRKSHRVSTDIALWIDERNFRLDEALWADKRKPSRMTILSEYDRRTGRPSPETLRPEEPAVIFWHCADTEDKAKEWMRTQQSNAKFTDFTLMCVQMYSVLRLSDRKSSLIPTKWRNKEQDSLMQKRLHDDTGDIVAMFEKLTGKKAKVTEISEGKVTQTEVHRAAPRVKTAGLGTLIRKKILDEMGFVDLSHIPEVTTGS